MKKHGILIIGIVAALVLSVFLYLYVIAYAPKKDDYFVGVVYDTNISKDVNDEVSKTLSKLEKQSVIPKHGIRTIEGNNRKSLETNVDYFIKEKAGIIVTVGVTLDSKIKSVAYEHPNIQFIAIDSHLSKTSNIHPIQVDTSTLVRALEVARPENIYYFSYEGMSKTRQEQIRLSFQKVTKGQVIFRFVVPAKETESMKTLNQGITPKDIVISDIGTYNKEIVSILPKIRVVTLETETKTYAAMALKSSEALEKQMIRATKVHEDDTEAPMKEYASTRILKEFTTDATIQKQAKE